MPEHDWTEKQGQYLAFITDYSVSPPAAHQMMLKLEELGFISRGPRKAL